MEPSFPLFRLPDNAIVHVLGNMYFDHLLNISFVSTKARTLVTSTLLEADLINIKVSRFIDIEVRFRNKTTMHLYFYYDGNDQNAAQPVDDPNRLSPVDITLPVVASLLFNYIPIHSSTPFNFIDWMNHIQTIFCFAKPPGVRFYHECERFDVQYLKEAIGNVDVLRVESEVTLIYSKEILKYFNTPNELFLERNPLEKVSETQKIFIQNFKMFEFDDVYSLDDLLMVNSEKVRFRHPISQKQFNRFVKLWINGSNQRQQYMLLAINKNDFVSGEVYLKGIKCMEMKEEAKKEIREKHRLMESVDMIKIKRKDGTIAVIGIKDSGDTLYVHFIVQH
ncbi:hypothetical protein CRE_06137 [Caenorhabditis remanei]|uniref:F-box domain-containing protein n=1 Tax=Caenorhabditis remanei TaxID=31234 RepID=E3NEE1_CAERE|nr:hypothetical protein CRE_06137 [Caenorhabditis remanei]